MELQKFEFAPEDADGLISNSSLDSDRIEWDLIEYDIDGDLEYEIHLALPGYRGNELKVYQNENKLTIRHDTEHKKPSVSTGKKILDRIKRPRYGFIKEFVLRPDIKLVGAHMKAGLLVIELAPVKKDRIEVIIREY